MEEDPAHYPWSSCAVKVGLKEQPWLDLDPFYLSLGATAGERAGKYAAWLKETIPETEWKLMREAAQRSQLTADGKFVMEISEKIGRRLEIRGPGRPRNGK
jgi:putative transposase